jgi:hypothetical protein
MNRTLDNTLVALVLLASAGYALSSLGPKGLRTRVYTAVAKLAARAPAWLRLGGIARRLDEAAYGKSSGTCGGCGSCGSDQSDTNKPPASDVRVPVAKIGQRG